MKKEDNKSTIQVYGSTRKKLKELKITNRESYDEIINRLIINQGGNKQ